MGWCQAFQLALSATIHCHANLWVDIYRESGIYMHAIHTVGRENDLII